MGFTNREEKPNWRKAATPPSTEVAIMLFICSGGVKSE